MGGEERFVVGDDEIAFSGMSYDTTELGTALHLDGDRKQNVARGGIIRFQLSA